MELIVMILLAIALSSLIVMCIVGIIIEVEDLIHTVKTNKRIDKTYKLLQENMKEIKNVEKEMKRLKDETNKDWNRQTFKGVLTQEDTSNVHT